MDETMLMKMLDEIDAMTSEEYWEFFNASQKLPDLLPVIFSPEWESVHVTALIDEVSTFENISFSTENKVMSSYNDTPSSDGYSTF